LQKNRIGERGFEGILAEWGKSPDWNNVLKAEKKNCIGRVTGILGIK